MGDHQNPHLAKVAVDSPNRCQAITAAGGQCLIGAVEGSKHCIMHGGAIVLKAKNRESNDLFRLAHWQTRLNEQKDHTHLKTLNNEIGILRILVEEKLNACPDPSTLMIHAQGISDLVMKLQNLVVAATRLDEQLHKTLNKTQVESYSARIIEILVKHVTPETLELVADELQAAMEKI